jgi:hypothetical protein
MTILQLIIYNIGSEIIYKNIKNGKQQDLGLVDQ